MVYVQSSVLEQLSYDEGAHTLCATFRNSALTHVYREVPQEIYDGLIFADSVGAYFNVNVRDCYDFEELN